MILDRVEKKVNFLNFKSFQINQNTKGSHFLNKAILNTLEFFLIKNTGNNCGKLFLNGAANFLNSSTLALH